ncbi:MAG: translation initiation factor IF-3 [Rickettsiales bacterium]|nr:translation initiation factor IF-3 [Rickettsiales bacterium]
MNKAKEPNINEHITSSPVRVVLDDGEVLGVMPIDEAREAALRRSLDLVEIVPQAKPPVCKIMDYGKFRFEARKKEKLSRKKQKVTHIKEVKLRPNIGEHDYQVKMKQARKFIEAKDKVKVSLRFRGREITHQEYGEELLKRFHQDLGDIAKVEQESKMEGRQLVMVLTPL